MKLILYRGSKDRRDKGSMVLTTMLVLLVVTGLLLTAITVTESRIQYTRQLLEMEMP